MRYQLRTYRIKDGELDEFIEFFHAHVVPAREALGFEVAGAWTDRETNTFVWIVGHEAPEGWEAAEQGYYGSDERAAMPRDPREFLASVETQLMERVR